MGQKICTSIVIIAISEYCYASGVRNSAAKVKTANWKDLAIVMLSVPM